MRSLLHSSAQGEFAEAEALQAKIGPNDSHAPPCSTTAPLHGESIAWQARQGEK
jgi:hypothetical protein